MPQGTSLKYQENAPAVMTKLKLPSLTNARMPDKQGTINQNNPYSPNVRSFIPTYNNIF